MTISKDRFVNPYAFVPLADKASANHGQPTWHDGRDPNLYSGTIELTWRLRTPLLLPANAAKEGWLAGDTVRVPGSSIAGATRSLHEALFNGCFRVIDDTYLPGYREAATSDATMVLAVVTKEHNGEPREVRVCDDPVWVDSGDLLRHYPRTGDLPTTGDILRFNGDIEDLDGLDRAEFVDLKKVDLVRRAAPVAPTGADAGARVLIVSSTSARKRRKKNGEPARALWAVDRLTTTLVAINPDDPTDAQMLAAYRAAAADTDDRRRLEGGPNAHGDWRGRTTYEPVEWWDAGGRRMVKVARRAVATGQLFVGDPVWVNYDQARGKITRIKLAAIWRRPGSGTVADRLPDHLKPCVPGDERGLCLSCATFGAADTTGKQKNQQVSYAGHVRFGAARGTLAGRVEKVDLAPLGAPRPGNGMFYLQRYQPDASLRLGEHDDHVATHWGSPDERERNRIAGRKFYWHSDPAAQASDLSSALGRAVPPRYTATRRQTTAKMSRPAELVPAGTVLRSRVAVDQLDVLGVFALLAALDPNRILSAVPGAEQRDLATHLGGGKPFGLGSVSVTIDSVDLRPLGDRYSGGAGSLDWKKAAFPFPALAARVGEYTRNLTALAAMLDLNGLGKNAAVMSYPPGSGWDDYAHPDQQRADKFAESFRFFGIANGEHLARSMRPWAPLPKPGENPTLPIDPSARRF